MKLATAVVDDRAALAVVDRDGRRLFDPRQATARDGRDDPAFASMLALIDSGPAGLDRLRRLVDARGDDPAFLHAVDEVRLLAPLPEPRQMRDAMTFPLHIRQALGALRRLAAGRGGAPAGDEGALPELPAVYRERPIYYLTNRFSVVGHLADVRWPRYSRLMDYELELGIVIGTTGANITAEAASRHIFGYTIYNDFSARDAQMLEMDGRLGPAKGKSFDTGNALGPWIVTPDELPDPCAVGMSARVNGETRSSGDTRGMLFSFEELIAYISADETLHAGEFIGSGTVGNGCGLELGRFLSDGDVVELEVDGIGVLRNRVIGSKG